LKSTDPVTTLTCCSIQV